MLRQVISDSIWQQLQITMSKKGCRKSKNNRNVMEAILWKLRTGAPWRDIPDSFCPWKTAYNRFNRWAQKGLWNDFFLLYEKKLIQNGCSLVENLFARLKHFRGIATRFEKLARNFRAMVLLACIFIWLKLQA